MGDRRDPYLFRTGLHRLLDEVNQIWRAQLAEGLQTVSPDIYDGVRIVFEKPSKVSAPCVARVGMYAGLLWYRSLHHAFRCLLKRASIEAKTALGSISQTIGGVEGL